MTRATAGTRHGASRSTRTPRTTSGGSTGGYFASVEAPLASLVFLLPLIILYEVGTWHFATDPTRQTEQRIIAFNLMQDFFRVFGASGRYLPAMAVVLILLCCHVARQDAWRVNPKYIAGMFIESLVLAIPLVGFGFASIHYIEQYLPLLAPPSERMSALIVLSIGAGIYEELVFRLIAFTCLSFIFVDVLGMRRVWAGLLMVFFSSLLFALYHYLGPERFDPRIFAFRTAAGCFFGAVFLFRGFGITAGTHAAYDIYIVLLRAAL